MDYKNKAFTLVELIVVITILAILGTIAFISLQGYSKSARDSRRISDINNIKKSLELYQLNAGKYPLPDNGGEMSYSGELIFTQGTIGDNVASNLSQNLQEKPVDPLYDFEYIYSLSHTKKEYELLSILENNDTASTLIEETYSAFNFKTKLIGNYNGIFVETPSFIVPIPSIITSEILPVELKTHSSAIDSMVINNGKNIPDLGNSLIESQTGRLDLNLSVAPNISKTSSDSDKMKVIEAIQLAYTGTYLANNSSIKNILSTQSPIQLVEELVLNEPIKKSKKIEIVDGVCGSDNGKILTSTPINLCLSGIASSIIDNGEGNTYTWKCFGKGGGTNQNCTADHIVGTRDVVVENGTGIQNWEGSGWGDTIITSCDTGYSNNTISCIKNTWLVGSWSTCSVSCGSGTQTRIVECKDFDNNTLADGNCLNLKDITSQDCNTQACYTYSWNSGTRGTCSASPSWSSRSSCSVSCGGGTMTRTCSGTSGTQTRTVTCQRNDGTTVSDSFCTGTKPSTSTLCSEDCSGDSSTSCNTQSCYTYSWYTGSRGTCSANPYRGSRGSCSVSCGGGIKYRTCYGTSGSKSRTVYCRRSDGSSVSDLYCTGTKPNTSTSCSESCIGSNSTSCNTQSCCVSNVGASCGCATQNTTVYSTTWAYGCNPPPSRPSCPSGYTAGALNYGPTGGTKYASSCTVSGAPAGNYPARRFSRPCSRTVCGTIQCNGTCQ